MLLEQLLCEDSIFGLVAIGECSVWPVEEEHEQAEIAAGRMKMDSVEPQVHL